LLDLLTLLRQNPRMSLYFTISIEARSANAVL
jgi:hypothetical protein